MVEIFAVEVPLNIEDEIINSIFLYLKKERKEKILRFKFKEDRYRTFISDILSKYLICRYLNVKVSDISIERNDYGKPYLENSEAYFNSSHSGKWVVCAIGNDIIGVDVEKVKKIDLNIAKRFFHNCEYDSLMDNENKTDYFFKLWTLKESFIKADGKGLSLGLDTFCILTEKEPIRALYHNKLSDFYLKSFNFSSDYKVAVCSKEKTISEDIKILDFTYLIGQFLKCVN